MLHINVASVIFGNSNTPDALPDLNFTWPVRTLSLGDLIARSVEVQVADLNDKQQQSKEETQAILAKRFLAEEDINEQSRTGKVALPRAKSNTTQSIDAENEIDRALQAFKTKKYKIFINGREYDDLNEQLSFDEAIKVKFMRIMPLAGG